MNTSKTLDELIEDSQNWGISRGITGIDGTGTLLKQLEKTQEELIETRDAALKWMLATNKELEDEAILDFKDGIGDIMVTIILAADMMGMEIKSCLESALNEISKRQGTMIDGMFVKDSPAADVDDFDDLWEDLDASKACQIGDETCESCQ